MKISFLRERKDIELRHQGVAIFLVMACGKGRDCPSLGLAVVMVRQKDYSFHKSVAELQYIDILPFL